jgi:regulator of sirC expression with transglutaminase-like and TPR domain
MTSPEPGKAWEFLREAPDEEIPLVWGALTIARDEYPDLDVAAYETRIAEFGTQARALASAGRDPVDAIRTLNAFLFDELGFSGNQADYYDPRNSYLNEVVERRLGIPISLGLIQMDVARQLGLTLHGVSFPGHFLVSLPVDGGLLVLDPYHKGRSLDANELKKRAQPHVGDVEVKDEQLSELLTPATNRAILTRMLRNLKTLYAEKEDWGRALRCTDRLMALDDDTGTELRDRGLLYLKVGHQRAARDDLSKYLSLNPKASDADELREMLIANAAGGARLN